MRRLHASLTWAWLPVREESITTPAERVERERSIDTRVAAALPPRGELEHMTFDAILALYTPVVVQVADLLGVRLTGSEVETVLERLVGVQELPPFRREHYDVLC